MIRSALPSEAMYLDMVLLQLWRNKCFRKLNIRFTGLIDAQMYNNKILSLYRFKKLNIQYSDFITGLHMPKSC